MMALLAGSKLAAHTLQLTTGSQLMLPDIFPGVEHLKQFNLRTDAATRLLLDTGHHLGAVAVPYALAVHEDFVITVLELLERFGHVRRAPGKDADATVNLVKAWNMHEAVWMTLGQAPPNPGAIHSLDHFHLLREMRNTQIHSGGTISAGLSKQVTDMSVESATAWEGLGRRSPADVISTEPLRFTTFDIFAAFATTKALGRVVNTLLREKVAPEHWAQICLEDYSNISSKARGSDMWIRGLLGHTERNYAALPITEEQILDAAIAAGAWTAGRKWTERRSQRGKKQPRDLGTLYPGT